MPRVVLHQFAANHKDIFATQKENKKETVSIQSFHCQLQDQVCTEPGIPSFNNLTLQSPSIYTDQIRLGEQDRSATAIFAKPLRGPPSI